MAGISGGRCVTHAQPRSRKAVVHVDRKQHEKLPRLFVTDEVKQCPTHLFRYARFHLDCYPGTDSTVDAGRAVRPSNLLSVIVV